MRRTTLRAAIAVSLTVALVPAATAAAEAADDGAATERPAPHLEPIRLDCAVRTTDTAAAVRCEWSRPTSDAARAVRLFRLDPATDRYRQVVFRTEDLDETTFTDTQVRRGHRYAYAVVVSNEYGRTVGRSRADWVRVPGVEVSDVEVIRLECALGTANEAVGCEWSRPQSRDAAVVSLWRSVDRGPRELIATFRPDGPNVYREPVPEGARKLTYAVIVSSETDRVIGRSRPETVRVPTVDVRPAPMPDPAPAADPEPSPDPAARPAPEPSSDPGPAPSPTTDSSAVSDAAPASRRTTATLTRAGVDRRSDAEGSGAP